MNNKMKKVVVPALLLSSTVLLAACGSGDKKSSSGESGSSYNYVYTTDINSLDYTFSARNTNSDHFTNFVDACLKMTNTGT